MAVVIRRKVRLLSVVSDDTLPQVLKLDNCVSLGPAFDRRATSSGGFLGK